MTPVLRHRTPRINGFGLWIPISDVLRPHRLYRSKKSHWHERFVDKSRLEGDVTLVWTVLGIYPLLSSLQYSQLLLSSNANKLPHFIVAFALERNWSLPSAGVLDSAGSQERPLPPVHELCVSSAPGVVSRPLPSIPYSCCPVLIAGERPYTPASLPLPWGSYILGKQGTDRWHECDKSYLSGALSYLLEVHREPQKPPRKLAG